MSHRIKHSLQTKHKNSIWALINSKNRLAAGGSWSPGTNTMNREEIYIRCSPNGCYWTVHLLALWATVNVSTSTTKVVLGEQKTMTQIYSVTIAVRCRFVWQDI